LMVTFKKPTPERGGGGYRGGAFAGLSRPPEPGGTGLALAQAPGGYRPSMVGEPGADCRVSHAHRGGVARLCPESTAGPALPPRAAPGPSWHQGPDHDAHGSRGPPPL